MPSQSPQFGKRRVGIAVDVNEESAQAVKWAVSSYIHPDDFVILLHVQPTDVLYGADWGDMVRGADKKGEADMRPHSGDNFLDVLTSSKLVQPVIDANIPYKIHIVKDYDRKERICLEAERLKLSVLIMGSRRTRARRGSSKAGSDSVSEYCVHHCECPVIVVRHQGDDKVDTLQRDAAALQLDSKI